MGYDRTQLFTKLWQEGWRPEFINSVNKGHTHEQWLVHRSRPKMDTSAFDLFFFFFAILYHSYCASLCKRKNSSAQKYHHPTQRSIIIVYIFLLGVMIFFLPVVLLPKKNYFRGGCTKLPLTLCRRRELKEVGRDMVQLQAALVSNT